MHRPQKSVLVVYHFPGIFDNKSYDFQRSQLQEAKDAGGV
jgi:hypothetical protein